MHGQISMIFRADSSDSFAAGLTDKTSFAQYNRVACETCVAAVWTHAASDPSNFIQVR